MGLLQGVLNTLEVEKASRADLELYTAILNTQKTALSDNVDRLREQLAELRQVGRLETVVGFICMILPKI